MPSDNHHKAWLGFLRKALGVPMGYTVDDLRSFMEIASRENPSVAPLVEYYLRLAKRSESRVSPRRRPSSARNGTAQMHLFDLLRQKQFFPQNSDLARFAARVVPGMRAYSFDKMARSDIAARIVEYIENSDRRTRAALESSMREALTVMDKTPSKSKDRQTFLSKWERIIKGMEL